MEILPQPILPNPPQTLEHLGKCLLDFIHWVSPKSKPKPKNRNRNLHMEDQKNREQEKRKRKKEY